MQNKRNSHSLLVESGTQNGTAASEDLAASSKVKHSLPIQFKQSHS